jgi:transposase InsO family protein
MPWQAQSIMALRHEFVQLVERAEATMQEVCRRFGISRQTGYTWRRRYRQDGAAARADRSRRPQRSPSQTAPASAARVVALREQHPAWGGRKLRGRLLAQGHADVPSASTITAILRRQGRLDPAARAQHTAGQRFDQPAPHALWQMACKGHSALAVGRCHPLTVLDDHSRLAVGLVACADERDGTVRTALTTLLRRDGLPWRILTDNGPPWGTPHPAQDLTVLSIWLLRLGVAVSHGRPYHPQTQGKAERFHRTLVAELLQSDRYPDLAACQRAFDAWRDCYNLERPHQALDLAVPASRYQLSPRPFPEVLPPLEYGPDDIVRTVHQGGQVKYRRQAYCVSQALRGQLIALRPTAVDGVLAVYFGHHHIRDLDLRTPGATPTSEVD